MPWRDATLDTSMADAGQVIEIRSGTGEGDPSSMALTPGTVLKPTSVGRSGMWRVDGQGVLDVHGYVYFDGKALFVQSADDKSPVMVNNHRVGTAWTQVHAPSTIALGQTELIYKSNAKEYEDGDMTVAQPLGAGGGRAPDSERTRAIAHPAMFKPNSGEFASRADDESTRFNPVAMGQAHQQDARPMARPAAGMMAGFPPPQMEAASAPQPMMNQLPPGMQGMHGGGMQGMQGMQGMPPGMQGMQGMPPGMQGMQGMQGQPGMQGMNQNPWGGGTGPQQQIVAAPAKTGFGLDSLKADWNAASTPKKLLLGMGPFLILAVIFAWPSDDGKGPSPAPSGSAMTSMSAPGQLPMMQNGGMQNGQTPGGQALPMGNGLGGANSFNPNPGAGMGNTGGGVQLGVSPVAATPTPPPAVPTPPPSSSAKSVTPAASAAAGTTPLKKSQERLAADAWTEGNFELASKLYEQLSQQHPENPAFREAARICHEKMSTH